METSHQEFDFDSEEAAFEFRLREQWAKNMRDQAEDWTEDTLCICWVTKSDGRHWKDWWQQLRRFEREHYLNCYRLERETADFRGVGMRPYSHMTVSKEELDSAWQHIQNMATEIRLAAIQGKPCPFRAHEDATPAERSRFEADLALAFMEAGVVLIEPAREEIPKGKRRK